MNKKFKLRAIAGGFIGFLVIAALIFIGIGEDSEKSAALAGNETVTESPDADANDADAAKTAVDIDAEEQLQFEEMVKVDIDSIVSENYIADHFGKKFEKLSNGEFLIPFSWESMPSESHNRAYSSVKKGLSKKLISDAAASCYDSLTEADVKAVVAAKLGDTIEVSDIKKLCKEFKLALFQNPVLFEGFVKLTEDLHYKNSKTFGELNPWVGKFLSDYKAARKNGEGLNHWLKAYENDETYYVTREYYDYVVWFLSAYIDLCEVNVERLPSKVNYHLAPGQIASQTKLTEAKYQEDKPALTFDFIFKDESVKKIGSNINDKRPEIFKPVLAKKRSKITPDGNPLPKPNPSPRKRRPGDPDPGLIEKPNPSATPEPTPTIKPKDPDERPTERPKDDLGPGEPEPTPRVSKSPSDDVQESQHQPQADSQTGGTSQPEGSLNGQPGAHTSEGGQTVTDVDHGDGTRTENERAETPEIGENGQAPSKPDDANNGNNNGDMNAPD